MSTQKIEPKQIDLSDLGDGDLTNASGVMGSLKHNRSAVAAPTGGDDFADGWAVGSLWFYSGIWYVCSGDGTWVQFYPASGGVPTSRTITATTPVRIDGGSSADLDADVTLSLATVPVGSGGTGLTTLTGAGRLLYSTSASALAALAAGTNGHYLTLSSGIPAWQALSVSLTSQVSGTLPVTNGGTGLANMGASGRVLYSSSSTAIAVLPAASDGDILTLASGLPSWVTPSTGGGGNWDGFYYGGADTQIGAVPGHIIPTGVGQTTLTSLGCGAAPTVSGTVAAVPDGQTYIRYATTAAAGTLAYIRASALLFNPGEFKIVFIFGFNHGGTTTLPRWFVGLRTTTANPTNVEPDTSLNAIGVGKKASDSNVYFIRGAGSEIDSTLDISDSLHLMLEIDSWNLTSGTMNLKLTDLGSLTTISQSVTSAPVAGTLLTPCLWLTNNSEADIKYLYFYGMYFVREADI